MLFVQVIDQGKGLSPADLSSLEKLFKSEAESDGANLGLLACTKILSKFSGVMRATSSDEK